MVIKLSFTDKKREEIKKYILRKIAIDDADMIAKTMDNFEISITSVKRYLQESVKNQIIEPAEKRACGYQLVEQVFREIVDIGNGCPEEDQLYRTYIANRLSCCKEGALRIWQYTCAEMLNNAIEHSRGNKLVIEVRTNFLYSSVVITDDGVGGFSDVIGIYGDTWLGESACGGCSCRVI